MEESSKKVWIVRLLALLVLSFGLSFLGSFSTENQQHFNKKIEIKTNGNVGEIIAAVEKLGRSDISIKTTNTSLFFLKEPKFLWEGVGMFIGFSIFLGIYHAIYCVIINLLIRKDKDKDLL